MEVSKLELSDELKYQMSSLTKVLLWMKAHPERCRNTTTMGLARTIGLDKDRPVQATTGSIDQIIRKLIKKGLVIRDGGRFRADFRINYGHPEMPPIVEGNEVKVTSMKTDIRKRGQMSFEKLQKAAENGELDKARNRKDVGLLAGYSKEEVENSKRGYSWVSNLIHRGHIKEEYLSPTEAKYTIIGIPDYMNEHLKKPKTKVKTVPKVVDRRSSCSYDVVKQNGGKLSDIIYRWFINHNGEEVLKATTTNELVRYILANTQIVSTFESMKSIINRLAQKGMITKVRSKGRIGYFDFSVDEDETTSDMDYEVLKENKTPEEQAAIAKVWIDEHENFEPSIADGWSYNKEEKEVKMEGQSSIELPDGKTINLTININFGK